jgi:uncharacterized protein with HEPN domain
LSPAFRKQHTNIPWSSMAGMRDVLIHGYMGVDPKTEQFTVLKSTSRNANVRQILGRPGELWLPESGADKLVVIRE